MANRRRRQGFLDRFRLDDRYLRAPDRRTGRVGLYEGTDGDGQAVLIKVWPRSSRQADQDVESIWQHELRQLHRLAGHPDAQSVIARLADAGRDPDGFYLVLEPGQRRPLATTLEHGHAGHWLRQPRAVANRLRLWRNLRRIACAIDALHSEGLLHRDLDAWSVLTAGGEEPDFQLTGFEWSMRLVAAASTRRGSAVRTGQGTASFRTDWALFARLVAQLVGADWDRVQNLGVPAFDATDHLLAGEVRLIRNLAGLEYLDRLDGSLVVERIDQIIGALAADAAGRDAKLNLVLNLASSGAIARSVAQDLGTDPINLPAAELQARVEADLAGKLLLIGTRSDADGEVRLGLRGHDFIYRLTGYRPPRTAEPSWEFAYCDTIEKRGPAPVNIVDTVELPSSAVEIVTQSEAPTRFARSRGRVRSWDSLRTRLHQAANPPSEAAVLHKALTLTLIVELLFAVAEAFPVEVVAPPAGDRERLDEEVIYLASRVDPDRDALARALGLPSPTERLKTALTGDTLRREGWILTSTRSLGERSGRDTDWKFEREVLEPGRQPRYAFTGTSPADAVGELFLIPEDAVGRDAQLRRRLKALGALRDHVELLRGLTRPNEQLVESHETLAIDAAYADLDESKQAALRSIIETLPLFLVQGPPGVGKTRLVRELVKRRFGDDASLRMLLTAQSNAAVDHLLAEVVPAVEASEEPPLIVRCRPGRDAEEAGDLAIARVSQTILADMVASRLVQTSRPRLREAFEQLERGARTPGGRRDGRRRASGLRNFEGVVMRAANIVFATTNSADLERLLDERSQFDWTIIEEAGKATGSELIAPQLLSHRRLMIGDHKQLPPFGAEQMIALLSNPDNVVKALRVGAEYIGRSLRDETTEAIIDEVEDDEASAPALCAQAIKVLTLFQTLIEAEFGRRGARPGRSFAARLNQQHRMHPAIAKMVADAFYTDMKESPLITHADSVKRFATKPCPVVSRDPARLPDVPIVLIDMPARQASMGGVSGDCRPRWHNPDERAAVAALLPLLEARGDKPPTAAILSPYTQQVRRLADMLRDRPELSPAARGFAAPAKDEFCHTVDSFQGSEADVTIVSMVRNNGHTSVKSALGFLSDFRRMNVLLSRAKWRLVLVGSFDFLDEVLKGARIGGTSGEIEFMSSLLTTFNEAPADIVRRVPLATLLGEPA